MAGRIYNPDAAKKFLFAGKARITLVSAKTGTRFTYRVKESKDGAVHFVSLLNGSDNGSDYAYIGYVKHGSFVHGGFKARAGKDASSVVAFGWATHFIGKGEMPSQLEVWHEGQCGRCGRALTVPTSIESGLGPVCASR